MQILTKETSVILWKEIVKHAEECCSVSLREELEAYLVTLLIRYANQPDITNQVLASDFLQALQFSAVAKRAASLREVGDQCLLFAGLFPHSADKKQVKISYFVDLGQSAYGSISHQINDLYGSLAVHFVSLMDVLQSINPYHTLTPIKAYEQWEAVGSQRALRILREYTRHSSTPWRR